MSTGGTFASIDKGSGSVPTTGSRSRSTPGGRSVPYRLTVTGPKRLDECDGNGLGRGVGICRHVASSFFGAGRGQNAFWTTDLARPEQGILPAVREREVPRAQPAPAGRTGDELRDRAQRDVDTFPDVLSSSFGRPGVGLGPILVRSSVSTWRCRARPWTASPTGGRTGRAFRLIYGGRSGGNDSRQGMAGCAGHSVPDKRRPREHEGDRTPRSR